jgi:undecaprenyl-phosphate galactose phosphotransferase/putative colanic acid biosynthesis UDP-glucose lipid carrier transferase
MSIKIEINDLESNLRAFETSRASFPSEAIPYLVSSSDALIVLLASLVGAVSYHWVSDTPVPDLTAYFALGLIASFIHIARQSGRGYYDFEQVAKPDVEIVEVLICWFSTAFLLAFFAFLFKIGISFSRGSFLMFIIVAPIALLAGRKLEKRVVQTAIARGAIGRRNMVLLGDQMEMMALEGHDLLAMLGAGEINRFSLTQAADATLQQSSDFKTLKSVASFVRQNNSSEILLAIPWQDSARIDFLREQLKLLPVSVKLLPDSRIRTLTNYASSARQQVLSIEIQRAPLSIPERIVKRLVDVVLALFALTFFVPLMALTALAIKLDGPGPVVFRQNRKGFNGQQFVMFKFRTMTVQENGDSVVQATRNDARVTSIGKLLRASSIDELPQLMNVLRGDMSLIGPRPHALAHDNYFEKVLEDYAFRHHVKPGMTGWAQVHGLRGATPTVDLISRRVKMDLWYINNWSLWLDVQIFIKTVFEVMRKRNAY